MQKITFYTNSIFPELTRIWYHFIEKTGNDIDAEVVIYDCGSKLNPAHFIGAQIIKHPNHEHGKKIDHFIKHNLKTKYFFLMDDDVFLTGTRPVQYGMEFLEKQERNAICTFLPRHHWDLVIKGKSYKPMGSYALLINSEIIRREGLSFRARRTDNPAIRNSSGYYDTADYINEQLLLRDYRIGYAPEAVNKEILTFWGTSSGYVSLVKRSIVGKPKMRLSGNGLRNFILEDLYNFQRAYMVIAVARIYEELFAEKSFLSVFRLDRLIDEIIAGITDSKKLEEIRNKRVWIDDIREAIMGNLAGRL